MTKMHDYKQLSKLGRWNGLIRYITTHNEGIQVGMIWLEVVN